MLALWWEWRGKESIKERDELICKVYNWTRQVMLNPNLHTRKYKLIQMHTQEGHFSFRRQLFNGSGRYLCTQDVISYSYWESNSEIPKNRAHQYVWHTLWYGSILVLWEYTIDFSTYIRQGFRSRKPTRKKIHKRLEHLRSRSTIIQSWANVRASRDMIPLCECETIWWGS